MLSLDQAHKLITDPERERSVVITDATVPDQPIVYVSQAFLDNTGYAMAEVQGRNPRFLQGPNTDRAEIARIAAALSAERTIRTTILNYRADGTPFWHAMTIRPSYDANGRLEHFIAVQRIAKGEADTD